MAENPNARPTIGILSPSDKIIPYEEFFWRRLYRLSPKDRPKIWDLYSQHRVAKMIIR